MTLETETVLDRRRMRRSLSLWRALAVVALVASVAALAFGGGRALSLGDESQIARVSVEGLITEDRDQLKMLKKIEAADHVKGLIVFINSPGGTTTGGEALFQAIREISEVKPVVAQFGTVAASAAYITGLATDHIVARGNTITGSVGVIFQWAEVSELLGKIGVKMNEVKSGPLKANPSPFQPVDEAGRRTAEAMVAESQKWFVGLVNDRRQIETSGVPGLEEGRVYSGREALTYKLIDAIGGEDEVLRWLREERGVSKSLKVVEWKPKRDFEWGGLGGAAAWAMGRLLGLSDLDLSRMGANAASVERLRLDGLVSVWHPAKN
jgi:protease-4